MKTKIITAVLLLACNISQAQWIGCEKNLMPNAVNGNDANWYVTSGMIGTNPGANIVGLIKQGAIAPGLNNFYIIETAFPNSGQAYSGTAYKLYYPGGSCMGTMAQATGLIGVTVLQPVTLSSGPPARALVVVGANNDGLFFGCSDRAWTQTNMSNVNFFHFPVAGATASKPLIIQNTNALSYEYYVCGQTGGDMYVMKIDQNGSIIWSNFYSTTLPLGQNDMTPYAMLEDPQNSNVLLIAGSVNTQASGRDGFIARIDVNGGGFMSIDTYGTSADEKFNSIQPAAAAMGGSLDHLVLGGASNFNSTQMRPWGLLLDMNGNPAWSNIIPCNADPNATGLLTIKQRQNSNANRIEYYGLYESTQRIVVCKLDAGGMPIHQSYPGVNSEFPYYGQNGTNWPAVACDMDLNNGAPTALTTGLHITCHLNYGSYNRIGYVNSYFNGESTCNTPVTLPQAVPQPAARANVAVMMWPGLMNCSSASILSSTMMGWGGTGTCVNIWNTTGSNLRTTAISENTGTADAAIFPNPTTGEIKMRLNNETSGTVRISLHSLLGQELLLLDETERESGEHHIDLDLSKYLQLSAGAYLLRIEVAGRSKELKVLYTGE